MNTATTSTAANAAAAALATSRICSLASAYTPHPAANTPTSTFRTRSVMRRSVHRNGEASMLEDDQCPVCGPRCLCSPASVAMCSFDDCVHPAESSGLCAAHRKQRQRTGRLVPVVERLEPRARLREAALALADADSEDDRAARRAQVRFMKTLKDLGWRKVERKRVRVYVSAQLPFPWMPREEWGR